MALLALLFGMLVGSITPLRLAWRRTDRRLGALPAAETPEALRTAELRRLGEAGTYILHVDDARGELWVAKRKRW